MGPSLSVNSDRASKFTQKLECPISLDNMTQAVTLMPCSHTFNESSIQRIPGFGSLEAPAPCEGSSTHITKVRMVNRINCPLCTTPVKHYYRNWALREVCQEIPALFGTEEEKKASIPNRKAVPPPKGTLQERFETVVGGIIAGFVSLWSIGFAMQKEMENNKLLAEIKTMEESNQSFQATLNGIISFVVLALFVGALASCCKK